MRLDSNYPSGMQEYLEFYGWHFSKKMCEWASKKMYKETNGKREYLTPYTKEDTDTMLQRFRVSLQNDKGYDSVYVLNMARADFYGSSIPDENRLALYVKDYIDDSDAYEGMPFTRFYADCIGSGTPIPWEEVI